MQFVRLTCRFNTLRGRRIAAGTCLWIKRGPLGIRAILDGPPPDGFPLEDRMWLLPTMYQVLLDPADVFGTVTLPEEGKPSGP